MIYNDGVKTDGKLRVVECPRCHNEQFGEADQFCIICGMRLYNLCLGEPEYDNFGNYAGSGEQHINPSNARFCAICGTKTTFFEEGLLVPYDKFESSGEKSTVKEFLSTDADSDDELPF